MNKIKYSILLLIVTIFIFIFQNCLKETFHGQYNNEQIKIDKIHESSFLMLIPLVILSVGSVFAGFIFKDLFIDHYNTFNFWKESIKFLNPLSLEHPPLVIILITPILVILSIPLSYYLFVKNKNILTIIVDSNKSIYNFFLNKWYFDELYEIIFIKPSKKLGKFFWKSIDLNTIDRFGPDSISKIIKILSLKATKFQSGFIYQYAFIMLLGFSAILTFLIIN